MNRVIHFEIQVGDAERAIRFYRELLGWTFTRWAGPASYWLVSTGANDQPGIDGGLLLRQGPPPVEGQGVNAFVCTVQTDALDALLGKVSALGGQIAMPKTAIPGVGWLAYFKDPEGNILGAMQNDPAAA